MKFFSKLKKAIIKPRAAFKNAAPSRPEPKGKPIGEITHYYGELGVAIVKFKRVFKAGEKIRFKGATTDFDEKVVSMQYNHKPVQSAKKGQEVGIKVSEKTREGDEVYACE